MQLEKLSYTLCYNIEDVWENIVKTKKDVVYKNDKLIETILVLDRLKKLHYLLEDKSRKIDVLIDFTRESDNTTKIDVLCSVKLRSIVSDLFSYLSINIKKDFDKYIENLERKLSYEI